MLNTGSLDEKTQDQGPHGSLDLACTGPVPLLRLLMLMPRVQIWFLLNQDAADSVSKLHLLRSLEEKTTSFTSSSVPVSSKAVFSLSEEFR